MILKGLVLEKFEFDKGHVRWLTAAKNAIHNSHVCEKRSKAFDTFDNFQILIKMTDSHRTDCQYH